MAEALLGTACSWLCPCPCPPGWAWTPYVKCEGPLLAGLSCRPLWVTHSTLAECRKNGTDSETGPAAAWTPPTPSPPTPPLTTRPEGFSSSQRSSPPYIPCRFQVPPGLTRQHPSRGPWPFAALSQPIAQPSRDIGDQMARPCGPFTALRGSDGPLTSVPAAVHRLPATPTTSLDGAGLCLPQGLGTRCPSATSALPPCLLNSLLLII